MGSAQDGPRTCMDCTQPPRSRDKDAFERPRLSSGLIRLAWQDLSLFSVRELEHEHLVR
jgi:hypothetical protein